MRHAIRLLAALFLVLGIESALAGDRAWYVGVGFGDVAAAYEISDFDDGSISAGLVDNSDSAWKIYAGYEFNSHFAIEVGFADLHNDVDEKTTFSGISDGTGSRFDSLSGGGVTVDIDDISGYFVTAIGSLPVTSRFELKAKTGVVVWRADQTIVDLNRRSVSLDGTDALVGMGLGYRFDTGIGIRGEVERYFNLGAANQTVATLSISFHF